MFALNLDENNRILSATFAQYASKDSIIVEELPEGNINDFLYVTNTYIYSPIPESEQEKELSIWDELDLAFREGVNSI